MANLSWEITTKRFVAFFDILGFKDMVMSYTHKEVLDKLSTLKSTLLDLGLTSNNQLLKKMKLDDDQTKSVTFSDSIMFFSKSDTDKDALKIFYDSYFIVEKAIEIGIAIKGAIAYGEITVDFDKSLFFGEPIIDAYLLHDDLQLMTTIMHHSFEYKIKDYNSNLWKSIRQDVIVDYRAILKSAKVTHKLIKPNDDEGMAAHIEALKLHYFNVSGKARVYIDNTLDFLRSFQGS